MSIGWRADLCICMVEYPTIAASSYYLGFFAELEAAEYAARRINPEFHRCSVCLP